MHLVYIDESGNTGNDLENGEQPIFVLCALLVPDTVWHSLDYALETALKELFPEIHEAAMEVHGKDIRNAKGPFKNVPPADRIALRDRWLTIANGFGLKVCYCGIIKSSFKKWLERIPSIGPINPHKAAFAFLARDINDYLAGLATPDLGLFISDGNDDTDEEVERIIRNLRRSETLMRLTQFVEKGFFIDSAKSRVLQLCDLCALSIRKKAERELGLVSKSIDDSGIALVEQMIYRKDAEQAAVLAWLIADSSGKEE